jgi:hypothetical protein
MKNGYFETRFTPDPRREIGWQSLVHFCFQSQISPERTVLERGCFYGHFFNNIVAKRRIAVDQWPDSPKYLKSRFKVSPALIRLYLNSPVKPLGKQMLLRPAE